MRELIGRTLDKYRIEEKIGQGGMATVFKAHQQGLERWVAVKVLPPEYAADPDFSRYFLREAQAIAQLEHPHILPVYDFGRQGEYVYLVMRYVENSWSLADVMTAPISVADALNYLDQVATALDYAHGRGIIHRDVKPANILLDRDWVLLADFGLARMVEMGALLTSTSLSSGTPAYMAPEQGSGGQIDATTDIYALGVIAYLMLTGQIPHGADSAQAIIYKRNHQPAPSMQPYRADIPLPVDQSVQKALASNPADRYQSAGAFLADLRRAVYSTGAEWLMTEPVRPFYVDSDPGLLPSTRQVAPVEERPVQEKSVAKPTTASPPAGRSRRLVWLTAAAAVLFVLTALALSALWFASRPTGGGITKANAPAPTARTTSVAAADTLFFEDFDGVGLDLGRWQLELGGGQVQVFESSLRMTSSGLSFPLIYTAVDPFGDEDDFRLRSVLQYLVVADRGTGMAIGALPADFAMSLGNAVFRQGQHLAVRQDSDSWRIVVGPNEEVAFRLPAPQLEQTEVVIDYSRGVYSVAVDGERVFTSPPFVERPTHIWLGSPNQAESAVEWSGLQVDLIAVEELAAPIAGAPTLTPLPPTATPSPEPSATPTPLGQNCMTRPGEPFAAAWEEARRLLGCPVSDLKIIPTIAEEAFQKGHLFWRSDTNGVYIVYDRQLNGTELVQGEWQLSNPNWEWDGSNPDGVGLNPPPGLVEPRRGFGWLWRTYLGGPEGLLGWALDKEYGFDNIGMAQKFEEGVMFKGSGPKIYILLDDGTFYAR